MKRLPRHTKLSLVLLPVALLLTGCTAATRLQVDVLYDDSADFGTFTTYRWETGQDVDSPNAESVDKRIRAAAEPVLSASGLRPAADGEVPDLLLTYYGRIEDNLVLEGVRWEVAPRVVWTGADPLSETRSGQVGTLILDFADAETERVVWSGVVTGTATTAGQLQARLEEAVRKALARFPPE